MTRLCGKKSESLFRNATFLEDKLDELKLTASEECFEFLFGEGLLKSELKLKTESGEGRHGGMLATPD
jgi:hypothetical protein